MRAELWSFAVFAAQRLREVRSALAKEAYNTLEVLPRKATNLRPGHDQVASHVTRSGKCCSSWRPWKLYGGRGGRPDSPATTYLNVSRPPPHVGARWDPSWSPRNIFTGATAELELEGKDPAKMRKKGTPNAQAGIPERTQHLASRTLRIFAATKSTPSPSQLPSFLERHIYPMLVAI